MKLTAFEKVRYARHLSLKDFGIEAQIKLKNAKVLIVGAGGLGTPALYYLTAAGVGTIGIIDFDMVSVSNLQRQILYDASMVGLPKVRMAAEKLTKLNPLVQFKIYEENLTPKIALEIFPKYDLIIDGTDNFATRYLINDVCVLLDKPFVYGSIFEFQGQVSVFNYQTKSGKKGPTYRCLFPNPPGSSTAPDCNETGVLGVLPGLTGIIQATEAIKMLTNTGEVLSGKVLMINTLTMSFESFFLERNPDTKAPLTKKEILNYNYNWFCGTPDNGMNCTELQDLLDSGEPFQLLDVRNNGEEPIIEIVKSIKIPLTELEKNIHKIKKHKRTIVMCKSGIRSKKAISMLHQHGFTNLHNLNGGADQLAALFEMKK